VGKPTREKVRGFMGDRGKVIPIEKDVREVLKRLGVSSLDELPESSDAEWDEFFKDPFVREFVPDLQRAWANNDEVEVARIWREIWRKNYKEYKASEGRLKKTVIGLRNSKGGFTCLDCITSEAWDYIDEDQIITFWDLRDGAVYQCDNCKQNFP
jgi:hypothetical protein